MIWQICGEVCRELSFSNSLIKHDAQNANFDRIFSNDGSLFGLPIKEPLIESRNCKQTIRGCKMLVGIVGDSVGQGSTYRVLNELHHGRFEEDFKGGGKVSPNISPNFDVNIVPVNVNEHVD